MDSSVLVAGSQEASCSSALPWVSGNDGLKIIAHFSFNNMVVKPQLEKCSSLESLGRSPFPPPRYLQHVTDNTWPLLKVKGGCL